MIGLVPGIGWTVLLLAVATAPRSRRDTGEAAERDLPQRGATPPADAELHSLQAAAVSEAVRLLALAEPSSRAALSGQRYELLIHNGLSVSRPPSRL